MSSDVLARLRAGLCAVVVGLGVVACGGDDDMDAAGMGETKGSRAARAELDRFRGLPRFSPPGRAFDARRSLRGKRLVEIPITSEVPFVAAVEKGMKQAAAAVGAELIVFPNQGKPSQWAQGISSAIARNADAIVLLAQDPKLIGPQIEQANEAGIPVILLRATGEDEPCPPGTICIPGPFERAGRLEADFVIADSGANADVVVVTSRDAPSTAPLVRGLKDEFARRCPECELRFVDVPIADWATRLRTEVQSALVRDPNIGYVIPIYDSMSQFAVPAIVAAHRDDRVMISTFNGTPFVLRMLQEKDVVAMDVGEDLAWIGWASMDQTFRAVAGEPAVKSENTPLRVFDDRNVDETGDPPRFDKGYGDAYVEGYRKLWGLTGDR